MKNRSLVFILFLTTLICFREDAIAQNSSSRAKQDYFTTHQCSSFSSEKDFVERAGLHCINRANTRACMKKAQNFFNQCRYSGDFKSIAKNIQRKLLVMLFITKSADYAKHL